MQQFFLSQRENEDELKGDINGLKGDMDSLKVKIKGHMHILKIEI